MRTYSFTDRMSPKHIPLNDHQVLQHYCIYQGQIVYDNNCIHQPDELKPTNQKDEFTVGLTGLNNLLHNKHSVLCQSNLFIELHTDISDTQKR